MSNRVTYLIANCNYEEYLAYSIDSALAQTYKSNICVIDDGSTNQDVVEEIVRKTLFAQRTPDESYFNSMRILSKDGHNAIFLDKTYGPSYARNRGIELTLDDTDVYAILDADDENMPNKIERCIPYFNNNLIGCVYADYITENTITGKRVREYKHPYDMIRLRQECIVHSGSLIRKDALLKVREQTGFYDETMRTCEDYDLWMRIAEHYIFIHVPEALSLVRVQPKNSTVTVGKQIWESNYMRVHTKTQERNGYK